jgi:hypothetical protein
MTQLSAVELADLARRVGFGRPDLHAIVAAALVTSHGNPDFEHAIYPGPVAVYKGLYGVDLCEWPELLGVDLADPWEATQMALELTHECSGLQWCPAVRSGKFTRALDVATVASSMVPGRELIPSEIHHYVHAHQLGDQHVELARLHNALGDHAARRNL